MDEREREYTIDEVLGLIEDNIDDYINSQYERLWKYDIDISLSLKSALTSLTKDDLTKIRQNLNLKGLSSLNKGELIDNLTQLIPENLKKVLYTFDKDRYSLLKRIIAKGGYIDASHLDIWQCESLRSHGIIFTGFKEDELMIGIPTEIVEVFNKYDTDEYRKIVDRNTLWINLVRGMLFYYGVMSLDDIVRFLERYTGEKCDIIEVLNVMISALEYYVQINHTAFGFKDVRVIDEYKIKHEQNMREDISYRNFTEREILRAARPRYIEKTPQVNKFAKYLKSFYDIENKEVDEVLNIIDFMIKNNAEIGDIITELQDSFEIVSLEQLKFMTSLLIDINNNTRLWTLKGYTPDEIVKLNESMQEDSSNIINIKTRKKIGRNDPCPCGSGKKYKKCCGR